MLRGSRRYRLTGTGAFEAVFRSRTPPRGPIPAARSAVTAARDIGRTASSSAGRRCRSRSTAIGFAACCACASSDARPAIERYDLVLRLKKRAARAEFRVDRGGSGATSCRPLPRIANRHEDDPARRSFAAINTRCGRCSAANCRFAPSCSDYAGEAVAKHGALKGTFLAGTARFALSPVSSRRLRPGSLIRFAFSSPAPQPPRAVTQAVMDTQRLILFVVFSFSALMLWEAWQKEFRPPPPVGRVDARQVERGDRPAADARVGDRGTAFRRPPRYRRRRRARRRRRSPPRPDAPSRSSRTSIARRSTPPVARSRRSPCSSIAIRATRPSPTSRC